MDEPETLLAAPPKEEPKDAPQETREERKRRRDPERCRAHCRAYRKRNAEECVARNRRYRAKHPGLHSRYSKAMRGRICGHCGRSDAEVSFWASGECKTCESARRRNGSCPECRGPLRKRRFGAVYCKSCNESERDAQEAFESLSEPQRRLTDRHDARRTLLLWDVLKATDGERIFRADYPELMKQDHNGWKRLTEWAEALPDSLARSEKEREGKGLHVVLVVKRRALTAFLEPLVQYFTWKGWDSMATPLTTLKKNAKR